MQSISNPYKAQPYIVDKDTAPAYWLVATLWRPMATGVQTNNHLTLIHQDFPLGPGPVTHLHPYDECFYIIEGEYTYNANGLSLKAKAGDAIFIPRYVQHSFSIDKIPAAALNFYTPSGFELLLVSIATPAKERRLPTMEEAPMPPAEQVYILGKLFGQQNVHGMPFVDGPGEGTHRTSEVWSVVQPYTSGSEEPPVYQLFGSDWQLLNGTKQTGGSYSLFRRTIRPVFINRLHVHDQEEAIYILSGSLQVKIGKQEQEIREGSFAFIPAGTLHSLSAANEECVFLNFYLPGYFDEVITRFGSSDTKNKHEEVNPEVLENYLLLIGTKYYE